MNPTLVRVTKLGEAEEARVRAGDWDSYVPGGGDLNSESLPVDYEMVGYFSDPPIPGTAMSLFRINRNGVSVPGVFTSSAIRRIIVLTENSVYRLEAIEGEPQTASPGVE